jgi:hypothetical protein
MRRIIERVVTVVTTTTWKISWENDPPPQPQADPISPALPSLETLSESTAIETKEVRPPETPNVQKPVAEGLPDDINTYP